MLPQSPSMLSLRGPEFEDRLGERDGKLPPIRQETDTEPFFQRWRYNITLTDYDIIIPCRQDYRDNDYYMRSESRLSINSPERWNF